MVLRNARGEPVEQRRAARSRSEQKLLQIPGLARGERQPLRVEHYFDRFGPQKEASVESLATGESQQHDGSARRLERHHSRDYFCIRGLRNFVMRSLVIAEVHRIAQRSGGLREHLEALAIERRLIG